MANATVGCLAIYTLPNAGLNFAMTSLHHTNECNLESLHSVLQLNLQTGAQVELIMRIVRESDLEQK